MSNNTPLPTLNDDIAEEIANSDDPAQDLTLSGGSPAKRVGGDAFPSLQIKFRCQVGKTSHL
jgi:hypothetical protein